MRISSREILLLAIALAVIFLSSCASREEQSSQEVSVPVKVERASKGAITYDVEFDAVVSYEDIVPLSFKVGGKVKRVLVKEGDRVRKGQLIAELDDADYRNKIVLARAALQAARANYRALLAMKTVQDTQAEADLRRAEEGLRMAKSNLKLAEASLKQAERDYQRFLELYESGAVSKQRLEMMRLNLQSARARYDNAKAMYQQALQAYKVAKRAPQRIAATDAQLRAAKASIEQAEANLRDVEKLLEDLRLISPADGLVLKCQLKVGMVVGPGVPLVLIGTSYEKVILGEVSDRDAANLRVGMLGTASWNERTFKVKLIKIYPIADGVGLKRVKLSILEGSGQLSHGDYVRVKIPYKRVSGLIVRRESVMLSPEGRFVFVVQDGVARRKKVNVLAAKGDRAVVSGLREGDLVVCEGQYFLKDGLKVTIKE